MDKGKDIGIKLRSSIIDGLYIPEQSEAPRIAIKLVLELLAYEGVAIYKEIMEYIKKNGYRMMEYTVKRYVRDILYRDGVVNLYYKNNKGAHPYIIVIKSHEKFLIYCEKYGVDPYTRYDGVTVPVQELKHGVGQFLDIFLFGATADDIPFPKYQKTKDLFVMSVYDDYHVCPCGNEESVNDGFNYQLGLCSSCATRYEELGVMPYEE